MKSRGFVIVAILALTLVLGFGSPARAQLADPTEEYYFSHVIPYYSIAANNVPLLVVSDTSFVDFPAPILPGGPGAFVHMRFFNQACNFIRDHDIDLTANDVELLDLTSPALVGIPTTGEIFLSTSFQYGLGSERFLTYVINIDLARNTLTRLESIPFDDDNGIGNIGSELWLRYDRFNTLAATFGDAPPISTTLTFFNALGGGVDADGGPCAGGVAGAVPCFLGSVDTLREELIFAGGAAAPWGNTNEGDWVVTGGSVTTAVAAGLIHVETFDDEEAPLGSFVFSLRCHERGSLTAFLPVLGPVSLGHAWGFSLDPAAVGGGGWSAFQETVVDLGAVDAPFSGYLHHSF